MDREPKKPMRPTRGRLWYVGEWRGQILVTPIELRYKPCYRWIKVRAHTYTAAGRVYIRGNLLVSRLISDYELDNWASGEYLSDFLRSRRNRRAIKWCRDHTDFRPPIVLIDRVPEQAMTGDDDGPKSDAEPKGGRRHGWKRLRPRSRGAIHSDG